MALNFSHRPLFPPRPPEDNLVSPMRIANGYLIDGIPEKVEDCFDYRSDRRGSQVEDCFDYRSDRCGSQESVHKDILDLLPSDPFGMDISTMFTAITGWLEDLEEDYAGYGRDQAATGDGNCQLFAGLDFIWNDTVGFQAFPGNMGFDPKARFDCWSFGEKGAGGFPCWSFGEKGPGGFPGCDGMELAHSSNVLALEDEIMKEENGGVVDEGSREFEDGGGFTSDGNGGAPHPAFTFALGYLGVRDLLVIEAVCKSLHLMVRNDPLLWRSIHIDQPLNEKITDDVLIWLTDRAQGNLQCLSLVECPRITDDALKHVVGSNPRLTKLSVPGCTRLSIEGIMASLKELKTTGAPGVKHLRIGGRYGVTLDHFEELKILLGAKAQLPSNDRKPHFYHSGNLYLSCEDDSAIDIELCPRCQNPRLVYDCPVDGCQGKAHPTQECRACTLCIARCVQCGQCINDGEYEETFCLELLCSDCWKQLVRYQEQDRAIGSPKVPSLDESNGNPHLCG